MDEPRARPLENVTWKLSYDRASIDRFTTEMEEARASLQAQIDEARARVAAAEAAVAAYRTEAQTQLGAIVLAAHAELAEIEQDHRQLITTIRATAEAEATRLLAAARAEAATMHQTASSLAQPATGGDRRRKRPVRHVDAPAPGHAAACRERLRVLADKVAGADAG